MAYTTVPEVAAWLNLADTAEHAALAVVVAAAEDSVTGWCGQRFDIATAATYVFRVDDPTVLYLGSTPLAAAPTSVTVDTNDDGTYDLSWVAADYQLEPFNGIADNGQTGWPYMRLRTVGSRTFPTSGYGRATVRIVGNFGWAAVPANVKLAATMTAAWMWTNRASPSGVQITEFGPVAVRRANVQGLLTRYRRGGSIVAIG